MTDVYTAKPSSDDSGFRHCFEAEALLPLIQSALAVINDITRLCWIDVTLWDCHIHANAVSLILDLFYVFPLV